MAGTFRFELITPERIMLPEPPEDPREKPVPLEVEQVVVPGAEGEFTVLAGHAPVISTLKPGIIEVQAPGGVRHRLFVKGGFAEVEPDHLTILAERAHDLARLDRERIAADLQAAEAELAAAGDDAARRLSALAVDGLRALAASA